MFLLRLIVSTIAALFRPLITPIKPGAQAISAAVPGQQGAMADYVGLTNILTALSNNGSPAHANWQSPLIPNSLAAATYSAQQMLSGIIRRFTPGVAFTDCTDTATNIVNAIPGAVVNQSFLMIVANLGSGIETLAAGTGVTLTGTATIASNATRLFLGQVTGSAAVTITSLFQFGNGTGFTGVSGL